MHDSTMTPSDIDRPLIIVSAGRSGSSVFHEILSYHPTVCWLPQGCENHPEGLDRYRAVFRAIDVPGLGRVLRRRFEPVEGYGFWDHHYPGFSRSCRDLRADDLTPRVKKSLQRALGELITDRRHRLLLKVTGWPRVGFLRELFPEAKFVHVVRDGRSVAASLLQVPWWKGWEGPENWRFGPLSREERETWEQSGRSFVALAGIEWNRIMDAMAHWRSRVPSDTWHTVRYEDFCQHPGDSFRAAVEHGDLTADASFLRSVESYGLESRNPKWKKALSVRQQRVLENVVSDRLREHGYA